MKSCTGRPPEPFWPSTVMKKWLNIKPKLYDFSEDEVDTETESEDDASSVKAESLHHHPTDDYSLGTQPNQPECPSRTSDMNSKCSPKFTHRRGKSETLHFRHMDTKEVRAIVGTWNVAGRLPNENLEIDDWLCTEEPADMYIIGFQEVVPLNAGNVLGAEDNRPILRWEAIIRRTLNKPAESKSKHNCCSTPPSPVLRISSTDSLMDKIETCNAQGMIIRDDLVVPTTSFYSFEDDDPNVIMGVGRNLQLRGIYGDFSSQIDWREQPLDVGLRKISSGAKLRRGFSSSARIGCKSFALRGNLLRRSHHSCGNLGLDLDLEEKLKPGVLDLPFDESNRFSLDNDDSLVDTSPEKQYNGVIRGAKMKPRPKYVRIIGKQMVGIYISIWVRRRLRKHINKLKVSPVGVGFMGYMGNKGSVSVSMSLFQSSICFVCSHLTSGQKDGDEQRRNTDVYEILRRTCFASIFNTDEPQTIPSHDKIFWFGDLNYRLNMADSDVRELVASKQWNELINNDQLNKELRVGRVFEGWKEGEITFAPTYKYENKSDRYVGETPREGEKRRSPAWCDRILWCGRGVKQLFYKRSDIRLSDHRPVSSMFSIKVEVLCHQRLQQATNVTSAAVHPDILLNTDKEF